MPDLLPYPIIVGVTGHRDIASEAQEAVRATVRAVLERLKAEIEDALHVMTGSPMAPISWSPTRPQR